MKMLHYLKMELWMERYKIATFIFIFSSATAFATNCGRGVLEQNFDNVWSLSYNPGLSRSFYTPLNNQVKRITTARKSITDLMRRSNNESLSNDPKWA